MKQRSDTSDTSITCATSEDLDDELFLSIMKEESHSIHDKRENDVKVSYPEDDIDFENEKACKQRKKKQKSSDLSQEVHRGTIVYQPDKYAEEIEERRLMEIIREGNDLIWADVRNVFLIQSRIRLWWPGRVLSDYEVNLLDPQDREHPIQFEKDYSYVELFGYRRNFRYYPVQIQKNFIVSYCGNYMEDESGKSAKALETSSQSLGQLSQYWKEGMRLLKKIEKEKGIDPFQQSALAKFEKPICMTERKKQTKKNTKKGKREHEDEPKIDGRNVASSISNMNNEHTETDTQIETNTQEDRKTDGGFERNIQADGELRTGTQVDEELRTGTQADGELRADTQTNMEIQMVDPQVLKQKRSDYRQILHQNTITAYAGDAKEEIHAGDLICYYYKPFGAAGNPKALVTTYVLSVYQEYGQSKLRLENGHVLLGDTQVRRVRNEAQEEIENRGSFGTFKSLSEYALIPGEMKKENAEAMSLYTLDHLRKDLMKIKEVYDDGVDGLNGMNSTSKKTTDFIKSQKKIKHLCNKKEKTTKKWYV